MEGSVEDKSRQNIPLNLGLLADAVVEIENMIADDGVPEEARAHLKRWWEQRKRGVKRKFQAIKRTSEDNIPRKFMALMAESLLMMSPPTEMAEFNKTLADYVTEMNEKITEMEEDREGRGWRLQDGSHRVDVIAEQYQTIAALDREVQYVLLGWTMLQKRWASQRPGQEWNKMRRLFDELEKVHGRVRQLRSELHRTQAVVRFVHEQLSTAYRTNDENLWSIIHRHFHVYENIPQRTPPVPIEKHISVTRLKDAYTLLKERRKKLDRMTAEVLAALTYQHLEGAQTSCSNNPEFSDDGPDPQNHPKEWAECFVSEQQQQNSLFMEKSLLEHAHEQLRKIRTQATIPKYEIYTQEMEHYVVEELASEIRDRYPDFQHEDVQEYLQETIKIIERTREELGRIAGGKLRNEFVFEPFSVYDALFFQVVEHVKKAEFQEARAVCERQVSAPKMSGDRQNDEITTIYEAEEHLDSLINEAQKHLDIGMVRRLYQAAQEEKQRVEEEHKRVRQLRGVIDELETRYEQYREEAGMYAAQKARLQKSWKTQIPFRWFFRSVQRRIENASQSAIRAYCACRVICPQDPWVRAWEERERISGCEYLEDETWIDRHIPKSLQPSTGAVE